jgi:hypothetical protein
MWLFTGVEFHNLILLKGSSLRVTFIITPKYLE